MSDQVSHDRYVGHLLTDRYALRVLWKLRFSRSLAEFPPLFPVTAASRKIGVTYRVNDEAFTCQVPIKYFLIIKNVIEIIGGSLDCVVSCF